MAAENAVSQERKVFASSWLGGPQECVESARNWLVLCRTSLYALDKDIEGIEIIHAVVNQIAQAEEALQIALADFEAELTEKHGKKS